VLPRWPACASSVVFDVGGIHLERGMGKTGFPHYGGLASLILPLVRTCPRMRGFCGWEWSYKFLSFVCGWVNGFLLCVCLGLVA